MADQQHAAVINALLAVAAAAFHLCDNTENDGKTRTVDDFDFQALSDALDKLDELPDDQPGYIMEGPAKASWALRTLLDPAGVDLPDGGQR